MATFDDQLIDAITRQPVAKDSQGTPLRLQFWTARTGGTRPALTDINGAALPGYVTPVQSGVDQGRFTFVEPTDTNLVLYADRGDGSPRWPVNAVDIGTQLLAVAGDAGAANATAAAASASQAQTYAGQAGTAASSAVAPLSAQQAQLMGVAATKDQFMSYATIDGVWNGTTWSKTITAMTQRQVWTAPRALRIRNLWITWDLFSIAQNATNYWAMRFDKYDGAASSLVVTKKTLPDPDGQAIAQRVGWDLAGSTDWSETGRVFAAGQILRLQWSPGGAPAAMSLPCDVTIEWEPLS